MSKNTEILYKLFLFIFLPSLAIVGSYSAINGLVSYNNAVEILSREVDYSQSQSALAGASKINAFIEKAASIPKMIIYSQTLHQVIDGNLNISYLETEWTDILLHTPEILDIWYLSNERFLDISFLRTPEGNVINISTTPETGEYYYPEEEFFTIPVERKEFTIIAPYYDVDLDWLMVSAVAPIIEKDIVTGVVGVDITISSIVETVNSIEVGKEGYAFLIADNGVIIAHPDHEYSFTGENNKTMDDWASDLKCDELKAVGRRMINEEHGKDSFTTYNIYFSRIEISGWSIGLIYPQKEIPEAFNTMMITSLIIFIIALILLTILIIGVSYTITKLVVFEEIDKQRSELSTFAHFMSHDIMNYLVNVDLATNLIKNDLIDKTDQGKNIELIELIERNIKNVESLLSRSLELADSGLVVGEKTNVELNKLVEELAEIIPEFICFSSQVLPTVVCDNQKIIQVFKNIIMNAINHGEPKEIKITASFSESKNNFIISLINNGKMIPKHLHEKIFDLGFSTKAGNYGFGLVICKRIVEAHGWNMDFTSTQDSTVFNIKIPSSDVIREVHII